MLGKAYSTLLAVMEKSMRHLKKWGLLKSSIPQVTMGFKTKKLSDDLGIPHFRKPAAASLLRESIWQRVRWKINMHEQSF